MTSRELLCRYIKDALTAFYDPVRLRTSPLVELLGLQLGQGESAPGCLRKLLREAINSLRPGADIPLGAPEWRGHRILWLRYIQAQSRFAVGREIGLSQTSYYRYHRPALEALADLLWEKHQASLKKLKEKESLFAQAGGQAVAEAARLAHESSRQPVDVSAVLASAKQIVQPLVQQRGLRLRLHVPASLPMIYGDAALLRQIIINVVTAALNLVAAESLELSVSPAETEMAFCLRGLDECKTYDGILDRLEGFRIGRSLVEAYGGRFWIAQDRERDLALHFAVPLREPQTILVVDDDADTVLLYRRYLQDYVVQAARSADEVKAFLEQGRPDLILLDVLMPREDGWDILRYLKSIPDAAEIPVVICSVLGQPQLALAMGAAKVLHKPIDPPRLLQAIRMFLTREGTTE